MNATPVKSPTVSVIVPNYNHSSFLVQRLESILGQTYADFEIVLLDDASTDNSIHVLEPYLGDKRIRFFPNEKNSGSPFVQWNRGVQLARGSVIWIAESDDYADHNFLSTMLPLLLSDTKIGLAYCQSWRVDRSGAVTELPSSAKELGRWKKPFINNGREECRNFLFGRNTVPNASAVLFRKDVYLKAGSAPTDMRLSGDWMMWVRMLLISDVAFVPATLNYFRHHDASVRENTRLRMYFEEKWAVQRLIVESCGLEPKSSLNLWGRLSDLYVDLPKLSGLGRWIVDSRIDSEIAAEKAYVLRKRDDSKSLPTMTSSILKWPLGDMLRYKVWLHMLLTRLGVLAKTTTPA